MMFFAMAAVYFAGDPYDNGRRACKISDEVAEAQGIAHRTAPCGSKVLLCYKTRCAIGVVSDRGPWGAQTAHGWQMRKKLGPGERWVGEFDLWQGISKTLGITGKDEVRYRWLPSQ